MAGHHCQVTLMVDVNEGAVCEGDILYSPCQAIFSLWNFLTFVRLLLWIQEVFSN